jgi:hypothetical protein
MNEIFLELFLITNLKIKHLLDINYKLFINCNKDIQYLIKIKKITYN